MQVLSDVSSLERKLVRRLKVLYTLVLVFKYVLYYHGVVCSGRHLLNCLALRTLIQTFTRMHNDGP